MSKITITLTMTVESDEPDEALPLLRQKIEELAEALHRVERLEPEVFVTLPQITVEETPDWHPHPGPGPTW